MPGNQDPATPMAQPLGLAQRDRPPHHQDPVVRPGRISPLRPPMAAEIRPATLDPAQRAGRLVVQGPR